MVQFSYIGNKKNHKTYLNNSWNRKYIMKSLSKVLTFTAGIFAVSQGQAIQIEENSIGNIDCDAHALPLMKKKAAQYFQAQAKFSEQKSQEKIGTDFFLKEENFKKNVPTKVSSKINKGIVICTAILGTAVIGICIFGAATVGVVAGMLLFWGYRESSLNL